ncbi:SMI1/KNR4 family protein [Fibrella arboris]|uniref:SMI1/KNR4 family protein n=1 Tax=Fibrella arboris TaxID=3242486 RepID=UPI00351FCF21
MTVGGAYLCIDYEPASGGKIGQIIHLPLGDTDPITAVADSFDDFLRFLVVDLDSAQNNPHITNRAEHIGSLPFTYNWTFWEGWSTSEAKLLTS